MIPDTKTLESLKEACEQLAKFCNSQPKSSSGYHRCDECPVEMQCLLNLGDNVLDEFAADMIEQIDELIKVEMEATT